MKSFLTLIIISMFIISACGDSKPESKEKAEAVVKTEKPVLQKPVGEPDRIVVQHILIGFKGRVPSAKRSKEEAQTLAEKVYKDALSGMDFDLLVKAHTNDQFPGKYGMVNFGVQPQSRDEYPREGMVAAFGDVGFKLGVDEIGMAPFDEKTSPYGWHIIKRIK